MLRFFRLSIILSAIALGSITPVLARLFFHSDFECGQTWTERKVEAGARTLVLVPNHRLLEWPQTGGQGIIERNLATMREAFSYSYRKHNTLYGVAGITKVHGKGVGIQTGGLCEWNHKHISRAVNVDVSADHALWGEFSAHIPVSTKGPQSELIGPLPQSGDSVFCRFYVSFSEKLLSNPFVEVPISFAVRGYYSLQRLGIARKTATEFVRLQWLADPSVRVLRRETPNDPVPVLADSTYCVEYGILFSSSSRALHLLRIDGVLQAIQECEYSQRLKVPAHSFKIGNIGTPVSTGSFRCDEIAVATHSIGAIPQKPRLRFGQGVLKASAFKDLGGDDLHAATHWQIHPVNAWAPPLFNTGRDTRHLERLDRFCARAIVPLGQHAPIPDSVKEIPTGLLSNGKYLARARQQNAAGRWSEWSSPVEFVNPAPADGCGKPDGSLPVVEDVFLSRSGTKRPLASIQRDKWYDLSVIVRKPNSWSQFECANFYLSAFPEHCEAGFIADTSAFDAKSLYPLRMEAGARDSHATGGALRGHVRATEYVALDKKRGVIRAPIRLSAQALWGTWLVAGNVTMAGGKSSPMHKCLVMVSDKEQEQPARNRGIKLGLAFLVLAIAGFAIHRLAMAKPADIPGNERHGLDILQPLLHADPAYPDVVNRAIEFVAQNYAKPISTQEIAGELAVSVPWLSRSFSQSTGKRLASHINETKIRHALRLLKETDLNVTEIANQVGYQSLDYFLQVFRGIMKMSPGKYRRNCD